MQPQIIYIAVAVIVLVLLVAVVVLKAKGKLGSRRQPATRKQVAITFGATLILAVLWIYFDLTPALLPVLTVPIWLPLLTNQETEPSRPRWVFVALASLGVGVLAAITLYLFLRG